MIGQFSEQLQLSNKHFKIFKILSFQGNKNTLGFHLTLVRMAVIKKRNRCRSGCRRAEEHTHC